MTRVAGGERADAGVPLHSRLRAALPPLQILIALAIAIATCIALRLVMILSPIGRLDADEAVTAIMARRILDGDFPAFYAGQNYLGTLEQYLQAGVLAVGPDSGTSLRLVQVALAAVTCALVYALGTRVTTSRWGGVLAAAIFAVGPYYNLFKGTRSHGAYAIATVLATAAALLALRLDARSRRAPIAAALLGLVCGLAIWQSNLTVYVLVPAAVWALGSARGHLLKLLPFGIAGALVGAAPLIAYRLSHGIFAGTGRPPQPETSYAERMDNLISPVTEMFIGLRQTGAGEPVVAWATPAWGALLAFAALGTAVWLRRDGLLALVTLREERRRPVDLIIAGFVMAPVAYGVSDFTWFAGEPRYLFTLYPFLAVALASLAMSTGRLAPVVATALVGLVLALSLVQIQDAIDRDGSPPVEGGGVVLTEDMPEVADALEELGVDAVYANYWIAFPLQFTSGDDLAVSPFADNRFPDIDAEVASSPRPPAYVAPLGGEAQITRGLRALGTSYRVRRVESLAIIFDLSQRRSPAEVQAAAG